VAVSKDNFVLQSLPRRRKNLVVDLVSSDSGSDARPPADHRRHHYDPSSAARFKSNSASQSCIKLM